MKRSELTNVLYALDKRGVYAIARPQLAKYFPSDNPKAFAEGLNRMVREGLLVRAAKGVFVNPRAHSFDSRAIEHIARCLRPGHYSYVSLESALSEYGVISQIPMDRVTIMTTGRSGVIKTPYGVIEFTHTKQDMSTILDSTVWQEGRPLRIATKQAAYRDLKHARRNLHLVDTEMLEETD